MLNHAVQEDLRWHESKPMLIDRNMQSRIILYLNLTRLCFRPKGWLRGVRI